MPGLSRTQFILLATLCYVLAALVWVFLGESLLSAFVAPETPSHLRIAANLFFIAVTAVLGALALRTVPTVSRAPVPTFA